MLDRNILIVDDEESLRLTFEMFLKRDGYTNVQTAATFEEALKAISKGPFDLIISDIVLGGEKGTELLRHIRETGISCPVVMVTGFPNLESASEAVRLGAFDYISKPVNKEKLLKLVRQALAFWELELEKRSLILQNEKYQHYLEAIFSSVEDAIIAVDNSCTILKLNRTAELLLVEFRDDHDSDDKRLPGEIGNACLKDALLVIEKGSIVREHVIECVNTGGVSKMFSINAAPLDIDDEVSNGAVIVVRDVTRAEEQYAPSQTMQFHGFIGASRVMQSIYRLIENVGKVETAVLITGESGTGKELAAEALHAESPRSTMPLVKVDCAALPEELLESELFGHRKGAFTGADRDRPGRLLQADKGTLLLDEIGDITPRLQLRLLRFLQEMTFTPVGMDTPVSVDVRVIAATNVNLREKVREGSFREDLYYRLKVVEVVLPPLRDRKKCLPLLIQHFLTFFSQKHARHVHSVSDRAMDAMLSYSWPGNVRELKHIMERGVVLCLGNNLLLEHFPEEIFEYSSPSSSEINDARESRQPHHLSHDQIYSVQQNELIEALREAGGNKSKAAQILQIDRSTLYRRLRKLKITTP
jgi:two-component system response regulator HydG